MAKKSTQKIVQSLKKSDTILRCESNIKMVESLIKHGHDTPENHIRLDNLKKDLEAVSK